MFYTDAVVGAMFYYGLKSRLTWFNDFALRAGHATQF